MPCEYGHTNLNVEPSQDFNVQTPAAQKTGTANPPIPESERPVTPEFLRELIRELDALRQRDSEIWADMYPQSKPGVTPKVPPYETREQYKRESEEISKKMASLQARINSMRVLLAARPPTEPELDKAKPASAPVSYAPSELEVGPRLPLQRPSESYTETTVPLTPGG